MRNISIIGVVFLSFLVMACTPLDVPPDPGSPGSGAPIGQAISDYVGAYDITSTNLQVRDTIGDLLIKFDMSSAEVGRDVVFTVSGEDFIYKKGYILDQTDPANPIWAEFSFDESTLGSSLWIPASASKTYAVTPDLLGTPITGEEVEVSFIAYACTKDVSEPSGWDCHNIGADVGHWMVNLFNVTWVDVPFDPAASIGGFVLKNTAGLTVAHFDEIGNLVLAGTSTAGGTCTAPADALFVFETSAGAEVANIGATGNFCMEGTLSQFVGPPCVPTANDEFIIKNAAGAVVSFVDLTNGDVCLTGALVQNNVFS